MTAILIIVAAIVLLLIGYVGYGSWLAKQWGIDPKKSTPAVEMEDGVDYVAAKPQSLWDTTFHPSREPAPSTDRSRPLYLDGFPYFSGVSSEVSSLEVFRISVPCLLPSATKENL